MGTMYVGGSESRRSKGGLGSFCKMDDADSSSQVSGFTRVHP